MNPPHRNVSVLLSVLLVVAALAAIIVGFVMRKKFFKLSTEALIWNDLVKYCFSCFLRPHFLFSFRVSLEGSASRGRGGYCDG